MKKLIYYILCILICCALCIDYADLIYPEKHDYTGLNAIEINNTDIAIDITEIPIMYLGKEAKDLNIPIKTGLKYQTIKY